MLPAALIYRRSIAKDVLGTDDPAEVQKALSDWTKFNEVAAKAKEKGYYMTASESATYRVFSNNVTESLGGRRQEPADARRHPGMDEAGQGLYRQGLHPDLRHLVRRMHCSDVCRRQDHVLLRPRLVLQLLHGQRPGPRKGLLRRLAICQGPQAHFWGGTWLLAAAGSDNPTMIRDIMNQFINDEDTCSKLVKDDMQFSNNKTVNEKFANDPSFGNAFLGGQNDTALYCELAQNIVFENHTHYDQVINESLQKSWRNTATAT